MSPNRARHDGISEGWWELGNLFWRLTPRTEFPTQAQSKLNWNEHCAGMGKLALATYSQNRVSYLSSPKLNWNEHFAGIGKLGFATYSQNRVSHPSPKRNWNEISEGAINHAEKRKLSFAT